MPTELNDEGKQLLVLQVRTAARKLMDYPNGLRLFCSDKRVLSHLLDQAEKWGSFLPIYLPSDLSNIVDEHKAKNKANDRVRVFEIDGDGDPAILLGRLWHVLGYHSDGEVRGCFCVHNTRLIEETVGEPKTRKLNILIGEPIKKGTDKSFRDLVTILPREQTVDLRDSFEPTRELSTTWMPLFESFRRRMRENVIRNETNRRDSVLHYIESAFLKHCQPNAEGDFRRVFPPSNLSEDDAWYDSDFQQGGNEKLAAALHYVEIRDQVAALIERLQRRRVIVVGGFGSGSDYLSRVALREMAVKREGGFFRITQLAGPRNIEKALPRLFSDNLHVYGTGIILRDLLDPVTANWLLGEKRYRNTQGILHRSQANFLHNNKLKDFLQRVRQGGEYENTRIIITSQYDTLDDLKFAAENPDYDDDYRLSQERRVGTGGVLSDFAAEDFWNPADEMDPLMMERFTESVFKAWLTVEAHRVPRWLGQLHREPQPQSQTGMEDVRSTQLQQLTNHGYIAARNRIAAWCRIWVRLLDTYSDTSEFDEVDRAARQYASEVLEVHKELHPRNEQN